MKNKFFLFFLCILFFFSLNAQTDSKNIRVVDTLTLQEMRLRNPILLQSELDSLIKSQEAAKEEPKVIEPVKEEKKNTDGWLLLSVAISLISVALLAVLFFWQKKRFAILSEKLNRQLPQQEPRVIPPLNGHVSENDKKIVSEMQSRLKEMKDKLEKLKTENGSLHAVMKEYGRTQNEFEALINSISKTFKARKYPGASNDQTDFEVLENLFETERSFTTHVYEQYVKPVTAIVDENKNNPSGMDKEQQNKLLELLISLSLLYIEYLYLRVDELSVGGNIVKRIADIRNGAALNPSLLKKLNTQNGSRALVLRMMLEKIHLDNLSYPVFEETDLNHR